MSGLVRITDDQIGQTAEATALGGACPGWLTTSTTAGTIAISAEIAFELVDD